MNNIVNMKLIRENAKLRDRIAILTNLLNQKLDAENYDMWVKSVNDRIKEINHITRTSKTPKEYMKRMRQMAMEVL